VSGLAIGSLITSLFCCIPGVGAVAVVLGIGAIVGISRSEGRLGGRALAFIAIVLGILGTMAWIGFGIVLSQVGAIMRPYYATMTAIEAGDYAAARLQMTSPTAALGDEKLGEFRDEYRRIYGSFREFPPGIGGLFGGWFSLGPKMQVVDEAQRLNPGKGVWPFPATFDNGQGLVLFVVQDSGGGAPRIENLGISGQGTGVVWLIDPAAPPAPPP
jgi:hypothetical protein